LRDAQDQWKQRTAAPMRQGPRWKRASGTRSRGGDVALVTRRSREAAVLANACDCKERLCDELDRSVLDGASAPQPDSASRLRPTTLATDGRRPRSRRADPSLATWASLPPLPAASEQKMTARRDAALSALADFAATAKHRKRIEDGAAPRREWLLELEMMLKLDSPPEFQALRLQLQVKQLKERFSSASSGGTKTPADLLLQWCAQPGVADAIDRQRRDRVFAAIAKAG
jgi:hypothetical protein